jgi:hypothetical protein
MGEGDALCLETHQLLERCGRRQRAWCSEVLQRRCKGDAKAMQTSDGPEPSAHVGVGYRISESMRQDNLRHAILLKHSGIPTFRSGDRALVCSVLRARLEAGVWAKRPDRVLVSERLGPENRKSQSTAEVSVAPAGDRQDAASRPAEPNCPAMPSSC